MAVKVSILLVLLFIVPALCSYSNCSWYSWFDYPSNRYTNGGNCSVLLNQTDPAKMLAASTPQPLECCNWVQEQLQERYAPTFLFTNATNFPVLCSLLAPYEACVRGKSHCNSSWTTAFLEQTSFFTIRRDFLCSGGNVHPRLAAISQDTKFDFDCYIPLTNWSAPRTFRSTTMDLQDLILNDCGFHIHRIYSAIYNSTHLNASTIQEGQEAFEQAPLCAYQLTKRHTNCSEMALRTAAVNMQLYAYYLLVWYPTVGQKTGIPVTNYYDPSDPLPEGNPADFARCTGGVTGDPHHFWRCSDGVLHMQTCSSPGPQQYLANGFFSIRADNVLLYPSWSRATTIQELNITLYSRLDSTVELSWEASNGALPSTFSNGQTTYTTANETIKLQVSVFSALIVHESAGIWIEIGSWNSNYFFTVRLSETVFKKSYGILKNCGVDEDISVPTTAAGRKKRSATTMCAGVQDAVMRAACVYDCTVLNYTVGCENMTSLSETSMTSAVQQDSLLIQTASVGNQAAGLVVTATTSQSGATPLGLAANLAVAATVLAALNFYFQSYTLP